MATNPQAAQQLPLLYKNLVPLSSELHPDHGFVSRTAFPEADGVHAVPITVDEFTIAQRYYPIVFNVGDNPAPLALMALHEGTNLFVDAEGNWRPGAYVPAYFRRYPFMLAQLTPNATELSLCFDDTSDLVAAGQGERLFEGVEPTQATRDILAFSEQFEQSVVRTRAFVEELTKLQLLTDGEVSIQQQGVETPSVFRGFQMVGEEKLQALRGDQARKMVQNGMLGLVYAHFFSMVNIRDLFAEHAARNAPAA